MLFDAIAEITNVTKIFTRLITGCDAIQCPASIERYRQRLRMRLQGLIAVLFSVYAS